MRSTIPMGAWGLHVRSHRKGSSFLGVDGARTGIQHRQAAAAHGGHGARAVGLGDVGLDANRVGELVLRGRVRVGFGVRGTVRVTDCRAMER